MALVVIDNRKPEDKLRFYQCGYCTASLLVDCRNCRTSTDKSGNLGHCFLDETAWYKGGFSIGQLSKPCCGPCLAAWPNWQTKQVNKASNHFWKHQHQICEGCVVTLEIEGVAVAADEPGVAAPAAAPTPQQPPPPPQPPINHAMQQLRIMETKVAVLEAQVGEMSEKFQVSMIKMQLALEVKMEEQEQRMSVRMDMRDDKVAELEVEIVTMSKTIDAQDGCDAAYIVPQKEKLSTGTH